jgi:hypothetical protein
MKAIILKDTPIPGAKGTWKPGTIWEGTTELGNKLVKSGHAGEIPHYVAGRGWLIQGHPSSKFAELRKTTEQGAVTLEEYYRVCPIKEKTNGDKSRSNKDNRRRDSDNLPD